MRPAAARCRWPTPSAWPSRLGAGRDVRHRARSTTPRSSEPSSRSSTCARPPSCATSTCAVRSTSAPRPTATSAGPPSTALHLGAHRQGRRSPLGAGALTLPFPPPPQPGPRRPNPAHPPDGPAGGRVRAGVAPTALVVRVLPDPPAIAKTFDYLVPEAMAGDIRVGTMVRVALHGRRVGAWVVEMGVEPPAGMTLAPIAKVTGWGPCAELFDLAGWASWRWAGRPAQLLRTASPDTAVRVLPPARPRRSAPAGPVDPSGRRSAGRGPGRGPAATGGRHLRPGAGCSRVGQRPGPRAVGQRGPALALRLGRAGIAAASCHVTGARPAPAPPSSAPGPGVGAGGRPGHGGGPRRARRAVATGARPHLARPRRGRRTGAPGGGALRVGLARPQPGGVGLGHARRSVALDRT